MKFDKKKFATLCLTGAMVCSLAACQTTQTKESQPPVESNPIETSFIEAADDKVLPMSELSVVLFEDEGVEFTAAESWRNKYYVEFNENDDHPRDKVTYFTYGEDGKGRIDLVTFELVKDETALPDGTDTIQVFPGDGFSIVKTIYPDNDIAKEMLTDLENDSFLYIPEPKVIPEGAEILVEAIENARSEEDNTYREIYADPTSFPVYDLLQIEESDVKNFAMSVSMMNVQAYSVIVIEPAEGKTDVIETALKAYSDSIKQSFENYLPDQLEIAENAQIEKFGDYVGLVICENAETVMGNIKTALS